MLTRGLRQTSLLRAVNPSQTTVYLFPAMNTFMYAHPLTGRQLAIAKEIGYKIVGPISKGLACGDDGGFRYIACCA